MARDHQGENIRYDIIRSFLTNSMAGPVCTGKLRNCLLAVRTAVSPFRGRQDIRSEVFESALAKYDELGKQLAQVQESLLQVLYESVPRANNPAERHLLLQLKRDIFTGRAVSDSKVQAASPSQRPQIDQYNSHLRSRTAVLDESREATFAELRKKLNALVSDEEFRLAVNYSCPWLIDTYHRHGPGDLCDFSNEERGIYSYATRFFSKANPFHLFAKIEFPASMGLVVENECEIVVDPIVILELEKQLLPQVTDTNKIFAYPCSFLRKDDAYHFLIRQPDALRQVAVRSNPVLELVVEFFQKHGHSLGQCVDFLAQAFPTINRIELENYLAQLTQGGILERYLVRNLDHFEHDLLGIDPDRDPIIKKLQQIHLAQVPKDNVSRIEQQIAELSSQKRGRRGISHYVNTYLRENIEPYEKAAEHFYADLASLKPLFALSNGFYAWSYVYEQFINSSCAAHSEGRIPYLELVTRFLRNSSSVVAEYHPSAHCPPHEMQARNAWLQRLEDCEGILSDQDLGSLLADRPAGSPSTPNLCFNGPVDATNKIFYVQNIFPGNARYLGRYLLNQTGTRPSRIVRTPDLLDVQVVLPYDYNRCYVAAMLPTGTGFHGRYRHKFDRWIDPGDIMIESRDGKVVYSDRNSGQGLRFHFFGFLLATLLPTEYQLLLTSHADFFYNPFSRRAQPFSEIVQRVPSLSYGSVCLRREQWRFSKHAFDAAWNSDDILVCSVKLLEMVRQAGIDFTDCYFELVESGIEAAKPRYLDMRNPLSVHTFRRAMRSSPPQAIVAMTRREPSSQHFFQQTQCPVLTELMIEV